MEKNDKKIIKQKNPTKKIDFSNVLSEITDQELIDYYLKFSKTKLEEFLEKDIPEQDKKIILKLLKKNK